MDKRFTDIAEALEQDDVKKAEVLIAKMLRGQNSAADRAELFICRAKARLQGRARTMP